MRGRLYVSLLLALPALSCDRIPGLGAGNGRTVAVGHTASGSLGDEDPQMRNNRGRYQVWTLRGKRGQRLVIDLTSSAFDPYLVLRDADGFLIGNDDDSGDELGARLRTILPRTGGYRILVTSINESARGDYRLTVSEWVAAEGPRPGEAQTLTMGESRDGLLEPGDEFSGDGPYQDRWHFALREGERVRVEMRSTDVDSYLILLGPDGRVLATNDDGLGGRDAVVVARGGTAGRYTALATTYGDQPRVGSYSIALKEVTGEFADPGTISAITDGETKEGQLEPGDSTTARGGYADVYQFRPSRSGAATINLTSADFDALLTLQDSTGAKLAEDDDGGEGTNSLLSHQVTARTLYRLVVSTFGSGRSGSYRLAVAVFPAR